MEMNTHTCNSIVTHEELKNIASVPTQIISPSKCNPIIYFVQDSLVASYLMTQDDEKIYRPKLENLMMNIKTFDGKYPSSDGKDENGNEYWLGRTVYSIVLPEISLKLKNDSDKMVTIKNGQFLEGNLDSTIIGKRGLIQDILKTYGTNRCHQFLDESQNMFTRWMETHGFSVGIGDGVPINKEMKDKIQEIIENKIEESKEVITSAYHGLYEQELDDTLRLKAMDLNMKKIGSDTVNDVLKYIKSKLTPDNRFNIMATSGAKGKSLNLQQIMGIVGQQEIWGTRILNGYSDRTLPHFHKNDFGLSAKGFVRNSYIRGVNPEEFFFSMMGGRVGMIDTAVKTSETGYISRKLMKAAEDVKILYDGTVRNAANNIIQFVYGDDNYDPIKLEKITIDLIKYNNLEMEEKFKFNFASDKDWENIILKSAMKDLLAIKDYQKILDEEYQFLIECRDKLRNEYFKNTDIIGIDTFMPFNLFKYLPAMKFKFNINDNNVSDLNPIYVIERVNELCEFATKYMKDKHNNILTKIIIKSFMSSKMIISHYKLNKLVFDYIIKELERKLMSAYVQPGEMVGPIAAQSLGESNQQLTLNSVAYDEKLIIVRDGKIGDVVQIGEFIDNIVNNTEDKSLIENHPNDTLLRWTKDTDDYKVISVDEDGVISWKKIEAVTRHPVINEDGSNTLVKVTTRNGRTVRATKAKSFLTRVDNKIVATKGSDLKVGDRLPVMKNFPLNDATIDIKYISNYDDNDDIIIGFNTDLIKGEIHKNDLEILLKKTDKTHKDYKILEIALYSDVYFDEIIKIEEIPYEREYVYDLTVEETRTFVHLNGVCLFDTFHQAGSAAGSVAVTSGVPRMKEIISLSKTMKTPSMDIYLSQEYADDRSKAEKLKNLMKYTKMESIVIKTDIIYENIDEVGIDVNDDEDMEFIKLYYEFNDIVCADNHEDLSKWVLRIEFDREAMMSKNILMSDVEEAIKLNAHSEDAIQCIINDDNSSNLIMRVRVKSETEDENFLSFFKEFEKYIMDMTLKGIKGINAVDVVEGHIVKYNPDGSYTINKEWFLRTDGSNLTETMLMDNVNTTRTFTNDIIETYEIFGIEGVRAKIVKELFAIFSEQGVNQRHINLMVDIMTNRGIIMQIDRHGINRAPDNGVMTKASFEQVTDVFIKASIFNEVDKLTGVSANIMFGQLVPSGTNMFELLLDEEKLMNFGISEEEQQEFEQDELDEDVVQEELNEMYEDMDEELEIGDDDFEFGYSLENVQEYNLGPIKTEEESESVKVVDNTVVKKIIKKKK
jgi:DNA-directed RNA polymerase beta' subunit